MLSSFAFAPRTVAKDRKKPIQGAHSSQSRSVLNPPAPTLLETTPNVNDRGKARASGGTDGKAKYTDEDYTNVICIAISDHALWSDPDLRRTVNWSSGQHANDGFIPLSYLLSSSKILAPLQLQDSQTLIVKALRSCASDVIDVRLVLSEPSSFTRFGSRGSSKSAGGYELRRKDWTSAQFGESSQADWDDQTIYVENIPPQYRTIPGIARFTLSLLSTNHSPTHVHRTRIQGIFLPPHHQDQPGDHPKCKGFALVTLQYPSDINFLLHRWPWDRSLNATQATDGLGAFPDALEASKFGFRTLPKTRWDELRDEYLAYRKRLVQEINAFEDAEALIHAPSASLAARKSLPAPPSRDVSEVNDAPLVDLSSPYPINSLIFVRNVHIETNKTTLRKLFATAFVMPLKNGVVRSDGIDYVDYNKGMDTCYIRLATPNHAKLLIGHFSANSVSQSNGLDDTGTSPDDKMKAIAMEMIVGKREELYWQKVPEKIRRQAVEKAVGLMHTSPTVNMDDYAESDAKDKRKRRKH